LDLTGAHLPVLCRAFDVSDELLFLALELYPLAVQLALGFLERALVLFRDDDVSADFWVA
jgi:hypothetical protein